MAKARCEGLHLNFRPYGTVADVQCCMCNMIVVENIKWRKLGKIV